MPSVIVSLAIRHQPNPKNFFWSQKKRAKDCLSNP